MAAMCLRRIFIASSSCIGARAGNGRRRSRVDPRGRPAGRAFTYDPAIGAGRQCGRTAMRTIDPDRLFEVIRIQTGIAKQPGV
jgi:hypothetical protein